MYIKLIIVPFSKKIFFVCGGGGGRNLDNDIQYVNVNSTKAFLLFKPAGKIVCSSLNCVANTAVYSFQTL